MKRRSGHTGRRVTMAASSSRSTRSSIPTLSQIAGEGLAGGLRRGRHRVFPQQSRSLCRTDGVEREASLHDSVERARRPHCGSGQAQYDRNCDRIDREAQVDVSGEPSLLLARELDAPILRATLGGVVGGFGRALTLAVCHQPVAGDLEPAYESVAHRGTPPL